MQGFRDVAVRFFVDLHLCPDLTDHDKTRRMIEKSAGLGYNAVGVALPPEFTKEDIERLRGICREVGLDFVSRVDLEPSTTNKLLRMLRRLRREVEIIAVKCLSKAVARQAAKDRRVDLLSFSPLDFRKRFFDSAEAELAAKACASLEFDLAPLIYLRGYRRIRLISKMREEVLIAKKFGVSIVLSSGANDVRLLRKPEDYVSLGYLFGLEMDDAKKAMSESPRDIIRRNRQKLSLDYVAPGIYVMRRGKNCSNG
jgi:ribonuclease P/MRP protein subunit RPP1